MPWVVGSLFAVSVGYAENRGLVDALMPKSPRDWLIAAGDVAELFADVERTLRQLRDGFAAVIWVPGNYELWNLPKDPVRLRGEHRYQALVEMCRRIGVTTPEDEFPVWRGSGGPTTLVPMFQLYDHSWTAPGTTTKAESLAYAHRTGVVRAEETLLHPDPYPDRQSWCQAGLAESERRLAALDPELPTVLVSHWPLVRRHTEVLWHPELAQWCGTYGTADWHLRFRAAACIYGHLHIPRTTEDDGVPFREVSLGYPREWRHRGTPPRLLARVLP